MKINDFLERILKVKELLEAMSGDELKVSFNDTLSSVLFSSPGKPDREIEINKIIDNDNIEDIADGKLVPTRTVYVIEVGEYSDRHVVAVCSTKLEGDRINAFFNEDCNNMEEFVLDAFSVVPTGHVIVKTRMQKTGEVLKTDIESFDSYGQKALDHLFHIDRNDVLESCVFAKDEEHAVKITNEFRAFIIASGLWKNGNTWKKGKLV